MNEALTPETILTGHVSAETAYVVDDYPYGFRLRCKIRYWIETHPKNGDRLCSQTTNPKVAGEVWNKPKRSTYASVGVMYLDPDNHVQWTALQSWPSLDWAERFMDVAGPHLSLDQLRQVVGIALQTISSKRAWSAPEEAEAWVPLKDRAVAAYKAAQEVTA